MAKRKTLQPQRLCIFCLGNDLSHEHIWPQWMHEFLPDSRGFNISRNTGREGLRVVREGQGSIAKQSLRVVCRACNHGWMERSERTTRPILEPMVRGQWRAINDDDQTIVAKWITMKAMVMEHSYPPHAVMSWDDRRALCELGKIPEGVKIYVAFCGHGGWQSASFKDAIRVEFSPTPPPDTAQKNVQITTIGLGMLLVHFVVSKLEYFDLDHRVRISNVAPRLWPLPRAGLVWPLPVRLNEFNATRLSQRISEFRMRPGVNSAS